MQAESAAICIWCESGMHPLISPPEVGAHEPVFGPCSDGISRSAYTESSLLRVAWDHLAERMQRGQLLRSASLSGG